ncbi:MAG TPA: MFS transporter [Polyangiaceae bacterium]|nr:MFS transporter [Polyangiaceae bacterium]
MSSASTSTPVEPVRSGLTNPTFFRILGVQMAFGLVYSAFLLLPKYLRLQHHASSTTIGWVAGAAVVAGAIFAPLVGGWAARLPRLLVLGAGMLAAGIAALGFAFVERVGVTMFVLRAVQGFAWAAVTNVTATLAADSVPKNQLARAIGYLGLSMLVTNAFAPAVTEPLAEHFGWPAVFAAAGLLAIAALGLFPGLPRARVETQDGPDAPQNAPHLLAVHYGSLVMGAGIGVMFTFTQPFALERGATRVGDFFFGYVAAAVFVRIVLSRVADSLGPSRVAAWALGLYAIVVAATAWMQPPWLIPLGVGIGISHGFLYPSLTAAGLADLTAASRSRFLGWFSAAFNTGFAVSVLLLGPIADRYGFAPVFLVVGAWLATASWPLIATQRTNLSLGTE